MVGAPVHRAPLDGEGIVLKLTLGPLEIKQALAVQHLVNHARRDNRRRRALNGQAQREVFRGQRRRRGWAGGEVGDCHGSLRKVRWYGRRIACASREILEDTALPRFRAKNRKAAVDNPAPRHASAEVMFSVESHPPAHGAPVAATM